MSSQDRLLTVLYVEDNDINWAVARLELSKKYNLVRARTSREAFAVLSSQPVNVILMDIELAGSDLNGVQITAVIRGKYQGAIPIYAVVPPELRTIPIIFVTACAGRYGRRELEDMGGDNFISKPINFTALVLAVSKAIARRLQM